MELAPAVEVVYALADRAVVVRVVLEGSATVREVIGRSGILGQFPEIDLGRNPVGVFGRVKGLDDAVEAGDRIEIYRPLPADPREMRRRRAKK